MKVVLEIKRLANGKFLGHVRIVPIDGQSSGTAIVAAVGDTFLQVNRELVEYIESTEIYWG